MSVSVDLVKMVRPVLTKLRDILVSVYLVLRASTVKYVSCLRTSFHLEFGRDLTDVVIRQDLNNYKKDTRE